MRRVSAALLVSCAFAALQGCREHVPLKPRAQAVFDFGKGAVKLPVTRVVYTLRNVDASTERVEAALSGDASLELRPDLSCAATLAPGGACSVAVTFAPTHRGAIHGELSLRLASRDGKTTQQVSLNGEGVALAPGQSLVTNTGNPVVARYSYQPTTAGAVHVEFGPTTAYGRSTNTVQASGAGPVSLLVAGMQQNSDYHMRAVLVSGNATTRDIDHTFHTASFPADSLPKITVTRTPGMTPQPGIVLNDGSLSAKQPNYLEAYATDLDGNLIWGYNFADRPTPNIIVQPIKLLTNGDMLLTLSFASQFILPRQIVTIKPSDLSVNLVREINLAGDPVRQLTLDQLNARLKSAGYNNLEANDIHHELLPLPNGHLLLIVSAFRRYAHLPPKHHSTNVLGDAIIDLDPNWNVSWVWNTFDKLDINRHPTDFPDWTHANAITYLPEDGDLLVSMRHQNWIVKVDYRNGQGSGKVLWRLGEGGDFKLIGGNAPQDWFYGQHQPSLLSGTTNGVFSLTLMDNGYERLMPNGTQCFGSKVPCYTTVPVFSVDTKAMTATLTSRTVLPKSDYSLFGGGTTALANGDIEYDLCSDPFRVGSVVAETTNGPHPQTVWKMTETGSNLYRANRIPSLYPDVQW